MPKMPHSSLNLSMGRSRCRAGWSAPPVGVLASFYAARPSKCRAMPIDHTCSASATAQSMTAAPPTASAGDPRRSCRSPTAGTPALRASVEHRRTVLRRTETTTRPPASPNSAAKLLPGAAVPPPTGTSTGSRCRSHCRNAHSASVTARPPSEQSCADSTTLARPLRAGPRSARARAARSTRGTSPATRPCTVLRYSLPPRLRRACRRAARCRGRWRGTRVRARSTGIFDQPTTPMIGVGIDAPCRRSRCRG